MQVKAMRIARIRLFSPGLPAADRARTGIPVVASIEEAVAASVRESRDRAVAVIPEGPYVVPVPA
jgi:hypothetical protein